jgi:Flp pilus assembly CpaE family ATPase
MKNRETSILLLSRTQGVIDDVGRAVAAVPNVALRAQRAALVDVNGHAAELAAGSDIVLFEADVRAEELAAIRALVGQRRGKSVLVALTDGNLPVSAARTLQNSGVDEIVPLPCSGEDIAEVVRKTRHRDAAEPQQAGGEPSRQGAVIAVARARGGIGATTIAVNLAYLLQDRRGILFKKPTRRVAIVDLELQFGCVGIFLDVEDRGAMLELASSASMPDRAFVRSAMVQRKCGLSVLPAPARPIPMDALAAEKVAALLDALRAEYDYVVVDMPHALVHWVEPVLGRAGKILVATDTTVPGIRHARRLASFYSEEAPALPIEIVVVHEKRPMFMSGQQKEAAKVLERPLTHWLPSDSAGAIDAIDRGEPIAELRAGSELSRAFRKMAKAIAKSLAAQPAAAHPQF